MMISKFHKLIQSKVIWVTIAIMIIFAFVVWAMPWQARDEMAKEVRHAGKLFGEKISFEEYRSARADTYLSLAMMMGQVPRLNDRMNEELSKSAWRRIASLKKARELGLTASNDEVIQAIKTQPIFQENGQYDARRFQGFVVNFLRQLGISEPQFENYVRQEIILQKLRSLVAQSLIISPYEIQRTFDTVNDLFDIQYAIITPDDVENRVNVTEEDIQSYFDENREEFMIPPKVSVKFVRFPVSSFTNDIEVTEEDALAYYDENIENYTEVAEAEEEIVDEEQSEDGVVDSLSAELDTIPETVTIPFEDVQEEIQQTLIRQQARIAASDKATDMVLAIANAGDSLTFEDAAEKFGVEVKKAGPFAVNEPIEGIDAGLLFNEDCFQLFPNPDEYFSNAIMGKDYVYVAALEEQFKERLPLLSEVRPQVEEAAEVEALVKALQDAATELQQAAEKAIESESATFAQTGKQLGYAIHSITNVSALSVPEDDETLAEIIIPSVLTYNQKEVTAPIPSEEGIIIAYVADRTPGTMTSLASLKPQIIDALRRERRPYLFRDWEDYLLEQGSFVDNINAMQAVEDEEAREDED